MPSWIDIAIALILLFALWRGARNGFIFELALSCAFFTGLYAGFKLAWIVQEKINHGLNAGTEISGKVSFIIVFIAVFTATILLGKLFSSLINVTPLGIFNRILGALFGLLRYILLLSLVLWFISSADKKLHFIPDAQTEKSKLISPVQKIAPLVLPVLKSFQEKIKSKMQT
ncbi:MAG: CvpA family protein [Bacteroidia bacterium]|nr:CvpA family protein [Bacteroidia bacterium]